MHRYIDADELLELYDIDLDGLETDKQWTIPLEVVKQNIKDMPTADVEPVRHGRWVADLTNPYGIRYVCSVCGVVKQWKSNYCPNCGTKMDKKEQKYER